VAILPSRMIDIHILWNELVGDSLKPNMYECVLSTSGIALICVSCRRLLNQDLYTVSDTCVCQTFNVNIYIHIYIMFYVSKVYQ